MQLALTPQAVAARVDAALDTAERLVAGVVAADPPTFATVLAPLEDVEDELTAAFGEAAFMGYVHDDPDVRAAARAGEERLDGWSSAVWFRDDLHAAVERFAATDEAAGLDGEASRLLAHVRRDLRRAGHALAPEAREELAAHAARLVELQVAFASNLAEHEDALLVRREDLAGLPSAYVEALPRTEAGDLKVTMAYPHVLPFLDLAERRDLRRELDRRFNTRAVTANRPLLEEAVRLRARIAELHGQPSWAHHQLELRMAGEPAVVEAMYDGLVPRLTAAAQDDLARMQAMLAEDTGDEAAVVQRWDWRYYHARLQRELHGVDRDEVAAHLPLDACLAGLLDLTAEVLGLRYQEVDEATWHPDVRTFEVHDAATDRRLAVFHMDLHPREGTYGHAAVFPLRRGRRLPDGSYQEPRCAIVANFTAPTADTPSLLNHDELTTFFHEFGHVLHNVLTEAELVRFAGTKVERDFVEAPSQIMEHWAWDAGVLRRFARHHATGAELPVALVDALVAARRLDAALVALRQVQFGWIDLAVHGEGAADLDLDDVRREAAELTLLPFVEETFFLSGFGHLMGGYDAGYYGYLWAERIGDDLFSRFVAEGITSPEVGAAYRREVLAPGGTRDADEHVRAFLGRDATDDAYLAKLGIA